MKRIYLAGKINSDGVNYLKNVSSMNKAALQIRRAGYAVYDPSLFLLWGLVDGNLSYQDYAENHFPWLEVSDAVLVLPGYGESKGTLAEIKRAGELGIPVIYSEGSNYAMDVEKHFKQFPFMGEEDV